MNFMTKMRNEQEKQRHGYVSGNAVDYAGVLAFQVIHDKLGYGKTRLARLAEKFQDLEGESQGFAVRWANELEAEGMNRIKLERICRELGAHVAKTYKARDKKRWCIMLTMATFTAIFHTLRYQFKQSVKKINMLIDALFDAVYVVVKGDVPIIEFVECLNVECDVECDLLEQYWQTHSEPIKIYGDYGKKHYKGAIV